MNKSITELHELLINNKTTSEELIKESELELADKFKEIATQCCMDNADSYKKLFTDTEFYQKVMEAMAKELYKALRKD